MGSCMARLSGWWDFLRCRKYHLAAGYGDAGDVTLIEPSSSSNEEFDTSSGIAVLSRGKIKYLKVKPGHGGGPVQMGIPVIDPLIGHSVNSTSLLLRAKMLVNKNHATCSFWQTLRDSTPPSSLDLEWEHEAGYVPPIGDGEDAVEEVVDEEGEEEEEECTPQKEEDEGTNDSMSHRSPSSLSACNSLEWDSNAEYFANSPLHIIKS